MDAPVTPTEVTTAIGGSSTGAQCEPIPLHSSSDPLSHSADAHTYVADQKIQVVLEWLAATVVRDKPSDVLYHIRNVAALTHRELEARKGAEYTPQAFLEALGETYTKVSDLRDNDNEIDEQGRPLRAKPWMKQNNKQQSATGDRQNQAPRSMSRPAGLEKVTLTYFSHRGHCDLPWMLAALSGVPFEMRWVTWDEFVGGGEQEAEQPGGVRQAAPFGQLPILDVLMRDATTGVDETVIISETAAISRFLATVGGFLPRHIGQGRSVGLADGDVAAMDSLVEQLGNVVRTAELLTASSTEEQDAAFQDILENRLPPILKAVNHRLSLASLETDRGLAHVVALGTGVRTQPLSNGKRLQGQESLTSSIVAAGEVGRKGGEVSAQNPPEKCSRLFLCGDELCWGDLALFSEIDLLLRWGATPHTLFERAGLAQVQAWHSRVSRAPQVAEFVERNWAGRELRW
eukprot:INCI13923.1.p1 GENE.INCI13923.1~~INCI13923.1.p1  ORF type:complete len:460 (-),score=68.95 INCI13923.1:546-1925(-)